MIMNTFSRMAPVCLFCLLSLAAPVFAEVTTFDQGEQLRPATPGQAADSGPESRPGETEWPWRRASLSEYVGSAIALAGTFYSEAKYGNPSTPLWTARNGFDERMRDALHLNSSSARITAGTASDVLMGVMIAAPVLEPFVIRGMRGGDWDAVWQTEVINLESFTFTGLVSSVMANTVKRERPLVRDCANGSCDGETAMNRSMPSGHTAFAFTGAGLICTHRAFQQYGDPDTDRAACATALGLATATGVLRIMADRHYATDVGVGALIGLFSGFAMPRLLHYSWRSDTEREPGTPRLKETSLVKQLTVSPQALSGGAALKCEVKF